MVLNIYRYILTLHNKVVVIISDKLGVAIDYAPLVIFLKLS